MLCIRKRIERGPNIKGTRGEKRERKSQGYRPGKNQKRGREFAERRKGQELHERGGSGGKRASPRGV